MWALLRPKMLNTIYRLWWKFACNIPISSLHNFSFFASIYFWCWWQPAWTTFGGAKFFNNLPAFSSPLVSPRRSFDRSVQWHHFVWTGLFSRSRSLQQTLILLFTHNHTRSLLIFQIIWLLQLYFCAPHKNKLKISPEHLHTLNTLSLVETKTLETCLIWMEFVDHHIHGTK